MTSRDFDPLRLDVAAFALAGGVLEGRWSLAQFKRVVESMVADVPTSQRAEVTWSARGEARGGRGGEVQIWLHASATTCVPLECQRCLKVVETPLTIERSFLFVHGEDAAAQLDTDSDDDVLALTRALDLRQLFEDELLLALPIVPRHEVCPVPLVVPIADDDVIDEKPNPFAALAVLRRSGRLN